jgi:hypothetical protein
VVTEAGSVARKRLLGSGRLGVGLLGLGRPLLVVGIAAHSQ